MYTFWYQIQPMSNNNVWVFFFAKREVLLNHDSPNSRIFEVFDLWVLKCWKFSCVIALHTLRATVHCTSFRCSCLRYLLTLPCLSLLKPFLTPGVPAPRTICYIDIGATTV